MTPFHQRCKKNYQHQTDQNINFVDESKYFINLLVFTGPPLGGALNAVLLPYLQCRIIFLNRLNKIFNLF